MINICLLTPHLIASAKKANIHIIYDILVKHGFSVEFVTYPVSFTYLMKHNRYRLYAFFKGFFRQRYIYTILPGTKKSNKKWMSIFCDEIIVSFLGVKKFDILIAEGPSVAPVISRIRYNNLIYRMSDHPKYCEVSDEILLSEEKMAHKSDVILSVLKDNLYKKSDKFIYMPNPSIYKSTYCIDKKVNECVYIGSNKINYSALLQLANNGIKINVYSEDINIRHENIIFHGLVEKNKLVSTISKYRVGIIPFELDDKNKHMEIPLKVFDYVAAGLKIFMLTSSKTIDVTVIDVFSNIDNYTDRIKLFLHGEEGVDISLYNKFLSQNSLEDFESNIIGIVYNLHEG